MQVECEWSVNSKQSSANVLIINLSIPTCQRLIYYIILYYQDNHEYPQISDLQKLHKDKQYIYLRCNNNICIFSVLEQFYLEFQAHFNDFWDNIIVT